MPAFAIDLLVFVLILGLTYALASEGLWGAALMFFCVLFAGMVAFNFYEPLAKLLADTGYLTGFADTLCLMGVFMVALVLLRLTTESIAPTMVRFPTPVYHAGRWLFAFAAACVTMSILLLAFDTAPIHKKVFGAIDYKSEVPFGMGLERDWLAFFQYSTGQVFVQRGDRRDPFSEYGNATVFDPRAEWLLQHQLARPYGEGAVLEGGDAAAPAAGDAAPAGAPPAGGAMPGTPAPAAAGGAPGDPKVVGPAVGGGVVLPQ